MTPATVPDAPNDADIKAILLRVKTIAMVGISRASNRPSRFAFRYLLDKGYDVHPVNPAAAGETMRGRRVYADLDALAEALNPSRIDMVSLFRPAPELPPIVETAIALRIGVIWMQLGIRHEELAMQIRDAGLQAIMDRCPKIEYGRLCGEMNWLGINSGALSSRRRAPTARRLQNLSLGAPALKADSDSDAEAS